MAIKTLQLTLMLLEINFLVYAKEKEPQIRACMDDTTSQEFQNILFDLCGATRICQTLGESVF